MRGIEPQEENRTGSLLIAHPKLVEPTFRKSVVFLASHDASGTLGFIVNKPTSRKVSDFIPEQEALGVLSDIPVFHGGPVGRNQLVIALFQQDPFHGGLTCKHNLSVEDVAGLAADEGHSIRAFVGHAGWGAGQLENELEANSWITWSADPDLLLPDHPESVWPTLLGRMGAWGQLQAGAPDDLSLN